MILNRCFLAYSRSNLGEAFSQPVDYFPLADEVKKVQLLAGIDEPFDPAIEMVVIGGGGILRTRTENAWVQIERIVDATPSWIPVVLWGIGINDHGRLDRHYDDVLANLEHRKNVLVSLRDSFYSNYVPCASCMRQEFDVDYQMKYEVGLYTHFHIPLEGKFAVLPEVAMSNRIRGNSTEYFRRVIAFLGSCETIVTNTYHGAYWATLLNRRVVVVSPFSNKFLGLRHEPVIVARSDDVQWGLSVARSYPGALEECRTANARFFESVRSFQKALLLRHSR